MSIVGGPFFLYSIKKERRLLMISANNLKVGYDEKIIIEDLSISICKGEIVSIIGPNGCGKSTLLKTLSRMIKPINGDVYLEDEKISEYEK